MRGRAVVVIVPRYHPNLGGWLSGLSELGHDVHVLVLRQGPLEVYGRQSVVRVPFHQLGPNHDPDPQAFSKLDLPSLRWIVRYLKAVRPSIVIVRTDPSLFAVVSVAACLLAGTRAVFYSQHPRHDPTVRRFRRLLYTAAQLLHRGWITPVDRLLSAESCEPIAGKVFVPFGVDCASIERDGGSSEPFVLAVGKFRPRKRLLELVRSLGSISPESRGRHAMLVAGQCLTQSENAYFDEIERNIRELELERCCFLLPNLQRAEVLSLAADATAVIVPSVDEPASISQVEAIALGTPAICTVSNGTAHYVVDTGAGCVVGTSQQDLEMVLRSCFEQAGPSEWSRRAMSTKSRLSPRQSAMSLLAAIGYPAPSLDE